MSTYTPISTQIISSATVGVTFESIPQYFTDLVLVVNGNTSAGPTDNNMRFNDDAGSNYGATMLFGQGSSSGSGLTTAANLEVGGIYWASGRGSRTVHIMNYANPNVFKNVLSQASSDTQVNFRAGTWRNTAPITSIYVFVGASTYVAGTTFNLYGIQEGGGYALGGDIVSTDGTYWYHTFLSSGAFIPTQDLTVDYLVVAGGGGGGSVETPSQSGGGGAGGLRSTVTATGGGGSLESQLSLIANTPYTVTIGAGGVGGTYNVIRSGNGGNSTFSTITSLGGGGGGGVVGGWYAPGNGGSGGGSGSPTGAGTGTANQGFNGGVGGPSGGGGAGEAGNSDGMGHGGDGVAVSISGTSVTYAGGGAGHNGTAGTGGGGGSGSNGAFGTGGGGGAQQTSAGGTGGSGIVIVRYLV